MIRLTAPDHGRGKKPKVKEGSDLVTDVEDILNFWRVHFSNRLLAGAINSIVDEYD